MRPSSSSKTSTARSGHDSPRASAAAAAAVTSGLTSSTERSSSNDFTAAPSPATATTTTVHATARRKQPRRHSVLPIGRIHAAGRSSNNRRSCCDGSVIICGSSRLGLGRLTRRIKEENVALEGPAGVAEVVLLPLGGPNAEGLAEPADSQVANDAYLAISLDELGSLDPRAFVIFFPHELRACIYSLW